MQLLLFIARSSLQHPVGISFIVSCFTNDGGARTSPGRWQTWQAGNAREWMA